jgi:hypothetical protein
VANNGDLMRLDEGLQLSQWIIDRELRRLNNGIGDGSGNGDSGLLFARHDFVLSE